MQSQAIHEYLVDYFRSNECIFLENRPGFLSVQLTVELDKALMNRPFYWQYQESIGAEPKPMTLNLLTDWTLSENAQGEPIHFGSPRLHEIFQSTKKLASHIRLYENCQKALFPWLCVNQTISYQCDRERSRFVSLGLNLINGEIVDHFVSKIQAFDLRPKIADMSYTLHPFITVSSGLKRLQNYLSGKIAEEDATWVTKANERWAKDQQLLDAFYLDSEDDSTYESEQQALQNLYEPRIIVKTVNGGMFYLSSDPM